MLWFRQAVPEKLRLNVGAIMGRPGKPTWELKWTLGTHDVRGVKEAMLAAIKKADAIMEAARNGPRPLTVPEMHSLADRWCQERLREWAADLATALAWDHWSETMPTDQYEEGTENDEEPVICTRWQKEWNRFVAGYLPDADEVLSSAGVLTDDASRGRLAELIVGRIQRTLNEHGRRQEGGGCVDTPPRPPAVWQRPPPPDATTTTPAPAPPKAVVVPLGGLFDAWKAVAVVKPRTVAETDYAVKDLAGFLGHDDAAKIARGDLLRWRDAMKADGRTNNTWNNRLSLVRQVLIYGVTERRIAVDPAEGLRLRKNRQQSPLPYNDDDAARILVAARQEARPSLRWCHWIMAFTGMRAAETMQLVGGDIRREGDIWFFDINEDTPEKSVKTANRRRVPIHAALITEGFLTYAQTIAVDAPLFPDKALDKFGNRGGRAWNVIGKWVRKTAGITDPQKAPDHSWRHRVEDELRAVEAPEDVRDAIIGHTRKTTGGKYGVRGEALRRLHRFLSLIPVPAGVFPASHDAAPLEMPAGDSPDGTPQSVPARHRPRRRRSLDSPHAITIAIVPAAASTDTVRGH